MSNNVYTHICSHTHAHVYTQTYPQGPKADVYLAPYNAAEAALMTVMVGGKNTPPTKAIAGIASDFKCNAVQGVLSHEVQQHKIDGEKVRACTSTHIHTEYTHTHVQPHAYIYKYIHTTLLYIHMYMHVKVYIWN